MCILLNVKKHEKTFALNVDIFIRNPLTRTENFEHPSGNIMKELTEAELNSVAAGAGVARNSGGIACTLTGECNIGTHIKFCCYD